MGYIKSYSNYVIQKKHQLVNNGAIFERDYSTVGGIGDNFIAKHRTYHQGTFVYYINNESITSKLYKSEKWLSNSNGEYWDKEYIGDTITDQHSLSILLKRDYYKLKDFAYYGSCAELIRSSINDIIKHFPGELYAPFAKNNQGMVMVKRNGEKLGTDGYIYAVDNPFNVDIHTPQEHIDVDNLDNIQFVNADKDKYEVYDDDGKKYSIIKIKITTASTYIAECQIDLSHNLYALSADTNITNEELMVPQSNGFFMGEGKLVLSPNFYSTELITSQSIIIRCYYDENCNICYLTNENGLGFHIRPKKQYFDEFYNSLDVFQKVLLNINSKPIYSNIFEVMEETEYGYRTFLQKFTFPLGYGGYNLDIRSGEYLNYINSLSQYALFFDEIYCNNLYRQMTHESIKNFDWTDVLQRNNETREDYIENGEKIQKMLLICGRELDEIKFYIDGISSCNILTYNDANNLPNYFLTDTVSLEGWDVKNVFPYQIIANNFLENLNLLYDPYNQHNFGCNPLISFENGYFSGYFSNDCKQTSEKNISESNFYVDNKGHLRNRIKQYINDKLYSMQELNDKFLKHLKLNSRAILSKKGTIESIESLLSLFGLKSKRWIDSLGENNQDRLKNSMKITGYDYEIKEYVAITNPIIDSNSDKTTIEFYNSTKNLSYNTYEYQNNIYVPYQGLPVRYYEKNGDKYLYPYFSRNQVIDGNPYYQMNGGWAYKNYELTPSEITENKGEYIDTNTHINNVETLYDLLHIEQNDLHDGIIYYVKSFKGDYVCANGELYPIKTNNNVSYIEAKVNDGVMTVGTQQWYGTIQTYDETLTEQISLDLTKFKNGVYVKLFLDLNSGSAQPILWVSQDNETVLINYVVIKDGIMWSRNETEEDTKIYSPYFILYNKEWSTTIGLLGWNRLAIDSLEYKNIHHIQRNYQGNNPHTTVLKYDKGAEYLQYFQQLFKYAISHEAFNPKCYDNISDYYTALSNIETIGFDNLFSGDCNDTIVLYDDQKVHHFCDYHNESGGVTAFVELEKTRKNSSGYSFYEKDKYNTLIQDNRLSGTYDSGNTCLDQIINLKNIEIVFKKFHNNGKENILQRKYFDEVILHYLLQIIPSNVILTINFN